MNILDRYHVLISEKVNTDEMISVTEARCLVASEIKIVIRHIRPMAMSGCSADDMIRILECIYTLTQSKK